MNMNVNASGLQRMLSGEEGPVLSTREQEGTKAQKNDLTIFAQKTNLTSLSIEEKRKEGRAKAMQVINDAWDVDKGIDKMREDHQVHYSEQLELRKEAQEKYNEVQARIDELNEQYEDQEDPAYREQLLSLTKEAGEYRKQINEADKQMRMDNEAIRSIDKGRLEKQPMIKASADAEKILEANNKEIMGMAADAAKEHIDEKMEEEKEKAEKLEEKQKEQEEFIEAVKEKIKEAKGEKSEAPEPVDMDDMLETALSRDGSKEMQESLDEIKNSLGLLEVDLKGLKVDEQG